MAQRISIRRAAQLGHYPALLEEREKQAAKQRLAWLRARHPYIRMKASPRRQFNTPFIPLRDKNRPFCEFWRTSIALYERIEQGSL
jgi:hypothetical protein